MARRRRGIARARRGQIAMVAATAGVCLLAGAWLATGPLLTVTDVRLTGYPGATAGPVTQAITAAAERGGSLVSAPEGAIRRAALADPWVADVVVHRDWPTGLVVEVMPAHPAAVGITRSGAAMLVSADGRSMGPAGSRRGLARVQVPVKNPLPLGARLPEATAAPLAFIAALDPAVAARVRNMRVSHGLVIGRLHNGPEVRAGTPGNMPTKAASLMAVLTQVSASEQRAAIYLDVSVPDHPALGGPNADPDPTRGTLDTPAPSPAAGTAAPNAAGVTAAPAVAATATPTDATASPAAGTPPPSTSSTR